MKGQINLDSTAGQWLYKIAGQEDVRTILEIGTWNGLGSTKCVLSSINQEKEFISIESDNYLFNIALQNNNGENVDIKFGHITEDLLDIEKLSADFFTDYGIEIKREWRKNDLENIKLSPNILDQIPRHIDFLILDGGEFSSWFEFLLLKDRSRYIFLDDTRPPTIKNFMARDSLLRTHQMIVDDQSDRNGYSIFKI